MTGADLALWKEPHGDWTQVGGVEVDPKNAKKFVAKDGKGVWYNGVTGRSVNLYSKQKFADIEVHLEFNVPKGSNSGIKFHGHYEIQILDSYMNETYANGSCGALYGIIAPSKNVSRPPEQWQSYDITFHSPRIDDQGKVTQKGQVTVVHNGVTVIDKGEFAKMTEDLPGEKMGEPGPIRLQDHGNKVRFRNIWLKPLKQ